MKLEVVFREQDTGFAPTFGEVQNLSDGGYERGYEAGYNTGYDIGEDAGLQQGYADGHTVGKTEGRAEGYEAGYGEGLAARTYETWTFTLEDGTVIEKDVALL